MKVKDSPFSGVLFSMRKTGKDLLEVLKEARIDFKIDLLIERKLQNDGN